MERGRWLHGTVCDTILWFGCRFPFECPHMNDSSNAAACLEGCTAAQREAIIHGEGPLLVLAGAGSGKTRVITRRIAHLIATGVAPHDILAITFTNKAADEMRDRVRALSSTEGVWLSTFHAMGARMLRHHAEAVGLSASFSIYDTTDSLRAVREVVRDLDLNSENWPPARLLRAISGAKGELLFPDEYEAAARTVFTRTAARVYRRYAEFLHGNNAVDFDDLLMNIVVLLRREEGVRRRYQTRFRYILIDEYQDTNKAQYEIANTLAEGHRNICATGDPDQSIYGWRGADIGNILAFERDYPDAHVVRLEQNYRSTKMILRAASALIGNNSKRKHKELWTENAEGRLLRVLACDDENNEAAQVGDDIVARVAEGASLGQIAIFYRTNAQSRCVEGALRDRGVAYCIVAGTSFFQRREIRDLISYLRVCANAGDDLSLSRIVNVPTRGLGKVSVERLRSWAKGEGLSLREGLGRAAEAGLGGAQLTAARELDAVLTTLSSQPDKTVKEQIEALVVATEYVQYIQRGLGDSEDRENNVQELISAAAEYDLANPEGGLPGFLERVALVSEQDAYDGTRGAVSLMTLHAAKGLEFPFVYILGLEDGLLPLGSRLEGRDTEEERRLFFVGLTRAKKEVVASFAALRSRFGKREYSQISPFLAELGPDVIDPVMPRTNLAAPAQRVFDGGGSPRGVHIEYDEGYGPAPAPAAAPRQKRPKRVAIVTTAKKLGERSSKKTSEKTSENIGKGDRVEHPTFGRGQVLGITGGGNNRTATIRFNVGGVKRIALRFKKLKKV